MRLRVASELKIFFLFFLCTALFVSTTLFATDHFLSKRPPSKISNPSNNQSEPHSIGIYFGGFGGYGFSFSSDVTQQGTALYSASAGGPLSVNAKGNLESTGLWFGGLHLGYEWWKSNKKSWGLTSAAELEGYYFSNTTTATKLVNPTARLTLHTFSDTFPMRVGVVIADALLAFTNDYLTPYISGGIGAGMVSIHDAISTQTTPAEVGINHFNSNPDAFDWSFAAQAKGGFQHNLRKYMRLFAEYRFLYLSSTKYTFGSTQYPTHVSTTPWNISFDSIFYNLFSLGIDFIL